MLKALFNEFWLHLHENLKAAALVKKKKKKKKKKSDRNNYH